MRGFNQIGLLGRLIISFIVIILAAASIMCVGVYLSTRMNVIHLIQKDVYHLIQKNNSLLDNQFLEIKQNIKKLVTDPSVYDAIINYENKAINILMLDRILSNALSRYQLHGENIIDSYIMTSYSLFGKNQEYYPFRNTFPENEMIESAQNAKGATVYFPTMKLSDIAAGYSPESPLIFSSMCLINSSYVEQGTYHYLPPGIEKPFLVINYNAGLYETYFNDNSYFHNALNLVIDAD